MNRVRARVRAHANLHMNLRASSFGHECPALTRRLPIDNESSYRVLPNLVKFDSQQPTPAPTQNGSVPLDLNARPTVARGPIAGQL